MTDKEKLANYGNRLKALDNKYKAGVSPFEYPAMKAELDNIFEGYKKDFGLPKGVSGNYGMDLNNAISQAQLLGADVQTRVKKIDTGASNKSVSTQSASKSTNKDPIVRVEVNKNTGNKRNVYRDANGKEYYGEVIKANAPSSAKTTGAKSTSASKTSKNKQLYGDEAQILIDMGIDPDLAKNPITVGKQTSATINKWTSPEEKAAWEKRNPNYMSRWKAANPGVEFDPSNKEHIKDYEDYHWSFTYNGLYNKLKEQHPDWSEDQIVNKAKSITNKISFSGKPGVDVNAPDQKWGNWHRNMQEIKFEDEPEKTKVTPDGTPTTATEETQADHMGEYDLPDYAPWWLQDQIALAGDAMDFFRVKKYTPWQATPDTDFVEPTFYDPTRELAANAEQANIAANIAATFTNPQQATAAALAAQAQAAQNSANILGRYNAMNVEAANQAENANTQIYNQASFNKAGLATQLYDKYTIANQQFDNSRNQVRQKLRQDYINAITNRMNTANLNTLYPQYAVDPSTGGRIFFHDPKNFEPGTKGKSVDDYYKEMLAIPGTDDSTALQLAKIKAGVQDTDYRNKYNMYTQFQYPGYNQDSNDDE